MAEMFPGISSRINTKTLSPKGAQYRSCYSARRNLTLCKWKVSVHFPESGAVRSIVPEQRCFEGLSLPEVLVMRHYTERDAVSKSRVFSLLQTIRKWSVKLHGVIQRFPLHDHGWFLQPSSIYNFIKQKFIRFRNLPSLWTPDIYCHDSRHI